MTTTPNTTAPAVIDGQLAQLYTEAGRLHARRAAVCGTLRTALGERMVYVGRQRVWKSTDAEAVANITARLADPAWLADTPWNREAAEGALGKIAEIDAALAANAALAAPLAAEWEARRWSRFFLVTSSDGHIHRWMSCSTCHVTTEFGWLPELSGLTEADAVAAHGPLLCSVCFPSAPVEWTVGRPKPARCAGTGERERPGTVSRRGGRVYGTCTECGQTQALTQYGHIRAHKPAA